MTELEKDISIDKFHLDDEAKALPSLIGKYHAMMANKVDTLNDLEFTLEREEAVTRKSAREMFLANGVKATVDMIADEVSTSPAIIQLRKKVAKSRTEVAYLKGVISALDAKKASLNNLVGLYIKSYYTEKDDGSYREADVKHRLSDEYEDMADKQSSSLAQAVRKRRG